MKRTAVAFMAFAVACSLIAATNSNAAVVVNGTLFNPGVPLTGTANFGGTVQADTTTSFIADGSYNSAAGVGPGITINFHNQTMAVPLYLFPTYQLNGATPGPGPNPALTTFTGTLRTVVVLNAGGTLDFYYQISNIASDFRVDPADIFRMTVDGFDSFATGVMDYSQNGLVGIAGASAFLIGNKSARTADRDPAIGTGIGFGFATNPGLPISEPNNLNPGDTSFFMVARTSAIYYGHSTATISGFGTAFGATFGPSNEPFTQAVPEPATLTLWSLGALGCAIGAYRRRKRA